MVHLGPAMVFCRGAALSPAMLQRQAVSPVCWKDQSYTIIGPIYWLKMRSSGPMVIFRMLVFRRVSVSIWALLCLNVMSRYLPAGLQEPGKEHAVGNSVKQIIRYFGQ